MRRTAAAVMACLALASPLAAQAAAAPKAPGSAPALSEENSTPGMSLNRTSATLTLTSSDPNPSVRLRVEATRAAYSYVTWSSSNVTVASVDANGVVTAHKAGTAIISCVTNTGEDASCDVTVRETAPALNETSLTLTMHYNDPNPTQKLYLKEGKGALSGWTSSDPTVASVSESGLVTALAVGKTTIRATTADGKTVSCTVEVKSDIGQVLLSESQILLHDIGGTQTLTAVMDGASVPVTWASSDPAVASVDANGVVTAIASGQATITVTAENGTTAQCIVYTGQDADQKQLENRLFLGLAVGGLVAALGVAIAAGV